jgi:hypothetical protein
MSESSSHETAELGIYFPFICLETTYEFTFDQFVLGKADATCRTMYRASVTQLRAMSHQIGVGFLGRAWEVISPEALGQAWAAFEASSHHLSVHIPHVMVTSSNRLTEGVTVTLLNWENLITRQEDVGEKRSCIEWQLFGGCIGQRMFSTFLLAKSRQHRRCVGKSYRSRDVHEQKRDLTKQWSFI